MRTFIALEMPLEIRNALDRVQQDLKQRGLRMRWVRPGNIHLTLKFLGEVDAAGIGPITTVLEQAAAACPRLILSAKSVGVFPNVRRPNVFWAGIVGDIESLAAFQRTLDRQLEPLGFQAEKRPFRGHLTLGRVKARPDRELLSAVLRDYIDFTTPAFGVETAVLFKSELKPSGAVYSHIAAAPLRGSG